MKKLQFYGLCLIPVFAISIVAGIPSSSDHSPLNQAQASPSTTPLLLQQIARDFGHIPLFFVPNLGQTENPACFTIQGAGLAAYFTPDGVTFSLRYSTKSGDARKPGELFAPSPRSRQTGPDNDEGRWTMKMDFVGARKGIRPEGLEKTGAVVSYFKGKPEEWETGLPAYSRIIYRELWPGIDLSYGGEGHKLKYEFTVRPGADPSQIRLAVQGAETAELTAEGRLRLSTPAGIIEDEVPLAYQEIGGSQRRVPIAYALDKPIKDAEGGNALSSDSAADLGLGGQACFYGFEIGDYDRSRPLIIDPVVLVYCGYIGGSTDVDVGYAIAVDRSGRAYVTGRAYSYESNFPVKVGPDLTPNGEDEVFVAKVNSSGTDLVYCGYIGGSANEEGAAIAVDKAGNAYITGSTDSNEATFPVKGGPDLVYGGGGDVFVAKVNSSGTDLVYCGYIGGSSGEAGYGVAVDNAGNAYVAGQTDSTGASFPKKVGPDLTYNGNGDAFVAKVDTSGTDLVYCGYIGGSGGECAYGLNIDGDGNAYVTGETSSTESTFPVTLGPDLIYNGGERDAFVAKVSSSGKSLEYCGYIGGSGDGRIEQAKEIAVDDSGHAFITGMTNSSETTFPVMVGPDLTFNGPGWDAFVAKVSSSGADLDYCGYIGGSSEEYGNGIAVDNAGNAHVVGSTGSSEATFPVVNGPDLTFNGGWDAFVAKINPSGTGLGYCGYIGGSDGDYGSGIALDGQGNAYTTGHTFSAEVTFPVLSGPDLTLNGPCNAFVAKINPAGAGFSMSASPPSVSVPAGQSASYTIQVAPEGGAYNSAVSLSCSGLPGKCTSTFSPESVTPGANPVTTTLTLATQASSGSADQAVFGLAAFFPPSLGCLLMVSLIIFLWFSFSKPVIGKPLSHRLKIAAGIILMVLLASCGTKEDGNGGDQPKTGTPAGTYEISIRGESGSLSASTTVTLIVT